MQAKIHEYPMVILEKHLDTFGHVNNAVYLEILEEARWDIIRERGFGIKEIREKGLGPTILEIQIRFLRELHLQTKILIKTQFTKNESKVTTLRQWIEDECGAKFCEAEFKIGLFDIHKRKLVSPTPEWAALQGEDTTP